MDLDAFRCMRQGRTVEQLKISDLERLQTVNIVDGGKHRALLMLHGFSSTPAVFRYFIPKLKHYNRIYAPLLPGHGESIEAFARVKANDWLRAVEQFAKELTSEYQQVDVMGLSLGGLLACHLAKIFSFHHLYLLAPALDLRVNLKQTLATAKVLRYLKFQSLRSAAGNIQATDTCEIAYKKTPLSVLIEILRLIKNFEFSLPRCPTDIFVGQYDAVAHSEKLVARFEPFVDMHVHWLKNSAHVLPLDVDRNDILACVEASINAKNSSA